MDNLNDKIKKKYYLKYIKYKTKYSNLLNKLKQQQNTNTYNLMSGGYYNVPKYAFTNDKTTKDIYMWNDNKKVLTILSNNYIYLSSSLICPFNYSKHFNINYCSVPTYKLYNLLRNISDEYYMICINYVDKNNDEDFQIGLTESINKNEEITQCARRGIIEELGLNFKHSEIINCKLTNSYVNGVKCFICKLSDLTLEFFDETTNLNLNGGKITENFQNSQKKYTVPFTKVNIFIYDTIENIIKYLSKRYIGDLTYSHYLIDNKLTITLEKLRKTNKEKKSINILTLPMVDIKNMLLSVHNKKFN